MRASTLEAASEQDRAEDECAIAGVNFTDVAVEALQTVVLEAGIATADEQFAAKPRLRAGLLQGVGRTLGTVARAAGAEAPQRRALESVIDAYGPTLEQLSRARNSSRRSRK